MFHSFDCFGVGFDGEPFCDRGEGGVRIVKNVFSAHPQLLSFLKGLEKLADVFV
jgi:hypothetical protein